MNNEEFRRRTKAFALMVIRLCGKCPRGQGVAILQGQVLRSSASVAANYREACRARSHAGFLSKVEVCAQEADESLLWLELLHEGYGVDGVETDQALREGDEILSILVATAKTAQAGAAP
jgi:four helix bundle protein